MSDPTESHLPTPVTDTERTNNVRIGCTAVAVLLIIGGVGVWLSQQQQALSVEIMQRDLQTARQERDAAMAECEQLRNQITMQNDLADVHVTPRPSLSSLTLVTGEALPEAVTAMGTSSAMQLQLAVPMSLTVEQVGTDTEPRRGLSVSLPAGLYWIAVVEQAVVVVDAAGNRRELLAAPCGLLTWHVEALYWYSAPTTLLLARDADAQDYVLDIMPVTTADTPE